MKILHVTLSFSRGGRREAILDLARGLAAIGVESHLCCLGDFECEEADFRGTFTSRFELKRRRLLDPAALMQLRRHCRQHGIDVLHAHDAASETTCALAMPWPSLPLLMTFHRSLDFESASRRDRLRNALVGLRAAAIVAASTDRYRHYLESNHVAAHRLVRIPLGIDPSRFHPDPVRYAAVRTRLGLAPRQTVLGAVGHFGREKGIDVAIQAFQHLCEKTGNQDAVLVVLGTGSPERQAAIRTLVKPEFAPRIRLLGFQPRSEEWLSGFDLLLHGARAEAFGLVLAEAMASGVPVIASSIGGIPDIVVDGECGRLVPVADPEAIADAAAALLASPGLRSTMAEAATRRARAEFDIAICARRHLDLYRALVAGQPPSPNAN